MSTNNCQFFLNVNKQLTWATTCHSEDPQDSNMSVMVMQFGQFLDHDITLTPEADMCRKCGNEPIVCCDYFLNLKNYTKEQMPEECWPIPVPQTDQVFVGPNAPKCLEFKRSAHVLCPANTNCKPTADIYSNGKQTAKHAYK